MSRFAGTASGTHVLAWLFAVRSRWKLDVSWTSIIRSRLLSASRIGGFFGWSSEPSASGKLLLAGGDVNPKPASTSKSRAQIARTVR